MPLKRKLGVTSVARRTRRAGLLAVLAALLLPATAGAADSIYWSREDGSTSIRVGNLDGTGGASTLLSAGDACGVAIDVSAPASTPSVGSQAGKIYWANWSSPAPSIQRADLDGSNVETLFTDDDGNLCGVAVDPPHGRIYWANFNGEIWGANYGAVGITGAAPIVTGEGAQGPSGVAVDPNAGKIYWTNQFPSQPNTGAVRSADLNGLNQNVQTVIGSQGQSIGVAVASGKIYWTNIASGEVRAADLANPQGTATTLFNSSNASGPSIDPTTADPKIYWASWTSGSGIRYGPLSGDTSPDPDDDAQTLFSGEGNSLFTALLKAPVGTGLPAISGGAGGQLTCSQGSWAPDLLGAFLYRAPASFAYEWKLNGSTVGTNSATFTPTDPGSYTCKVTASNQAGAGVQTSAARVVNVCNGVQATIVATGPGTTNGTNANDVIVGSTGIDRIDARNGDDTVCAAGGNDTVGGGNGNDWISGGDGADNLTGGNGNDTLNGNADNDTIRGEVGNDALDGGPNTDNCDGGSGANTVVNCAP